MLRRRKECDWVVKRRGVSWRDLNRLRQGENSILYQTDRMFLGNKDHNLNNVQVFQLSAGNAGL